MKNIDAFIAAKNNKEGWYKIKTYDGDWVNGWGGIWTNYDHPDGLSYPNAVYLGRESEGVKTYTWKWMAFNDGKYCGFYEFDEVEDIGSFEEGELTLKMG